jgi:Phospholipase_D-nuclease N-terminal
MIWHHWGYAPFGVIGLLLALWAIFHIAQSAVSPFSKALWVVLVLCLPLFGFLAWLFFGPRSVR